MVVGFQVTRVVTTAGMPARARSRAATHSIWVLLPAPSMPSKVMNFPRMECLFAALVLVDRAVVFG